MLLPVTLVFLIFFFLEQRLGEGGASEPSMGDGSLKTVEVWRTGQGNLPILGSVDIMEYTDISGRLGGTLAGS